MLFLETASHGLAHGFFESTHAILQGLRAFEFEGHLELDQRHSCTKIAGL